MWFQLVCFIIIIFGIIIIIMICIIIIIIIVIAYVITLPVGQAYERQAGEDCLEDEFTCNDTVCIPISWRCDGLVDCDDELDETSCDSDKAGQNNNDSNI